MRIVVYYAPVQYYFSVLEIQRRIREQRRAENLQRMMERLVIETCDFRVRQEECSSIECI